MDYDTAMEGHSVRYNEASREIMSHGEQNHCVRYFQQGKEKIMVWETGQEQADILPLNSAAILEWLGY